MTAEKGQLPVRFPVETKQDLAVIAAALGMSSNAAVNQAVELWIETQRSLPEVQRAIGRNLLNDPS